MVLSEVVGWFPPPNQDWILGQLGLDSRNLHNLWEYTVDSAAVFVRSMRYVQLPDRKNFTYAMTSHTSHTRKPRMYTLISDAL
jgi:hypothetical protein